MNIQKRRSASHKLDPKNASFLFSSSARVRHTRKLPSIDDRSLIAKPTDSFKQPTYILEQAVHLAQDVESLRKELTPLRLQYESLRSTIDYTDETQEDVDPLEEISRREGYSRLHRLQDEIRELDSQMSLLNTTFVDQSKNDLNAKVTEQYQMKAQADIDIANLREAIQIQTKSLENQGDSKFKDKILENDKKIQELKEVLSDLRNEEGKLLEKHKQTFKTKPKKEELVQIQLGLQKQLKSLEYQTSQRRVELAKIRNCQAYTKKDIEGCLEEQRNKANQQKITEMYLERNRKSTSCSVVDDEKEKEYIQSLVNFYRDDDQQTELVRTRIKRRHKHFHASTKDGNSVNEEIPENIENDNNENLENQENQVLEKSSVTPHESVAHYSAIEPVGSNKENEELINEEEEALSAEHSENGIENKMTDENVNEILMKNLQNLEMNIQS